MSSATVRLASGSSPESGMPTRSGTPRGPAEVPQAPRQDRVEGLHDPGTREVRLKELARGGAARVQLLEVAVAPRVVVVGVDHDLAVESGRSAVPGTGRMVPTPRPRRRRRRLLRPSSLVPPPPAPRRVPQRGGATGVAHRHPVPGAHEVAGERAADVSCADDPDPHRRPFLVLLSNRGRLASP